VTPAILAEKLEKRYGDLLAVKGIDFRVEGGERFGVLGPNGAGKSSTMKMIYGRTAVSGGRLQVLGVDVARDPLAVKRRLGVVPQDNNLDPDLTVQENLEAFARFYGYSRGEAQARARAGLERVDLAAFARARPDDLSGGMKRRLVIARALLHDPELVVLDEPTTGLDPRARHLLWQQLEALADTGVTLVLTTHYMDEAARLCARIVAMDRGRILAEGTPAAIVRETVGHEVLEWPAARWRAEWAGRLRGLLRRALPVGATMYLYGDEAEPLWRAVAELAGEEAGGPSRPRMRPATLEDAFLALSGHEIHEEEAS
jgi:lipooligosaccharide transport system ATP-binding protein